MEHRRLPPALWFMCREVMRGDLLRFNPRPCTTPLCMMYGCSLHGSKTLLQYMQHSKHLRSCHACMSSSLQRIRCLYLDPVCSDCSSSPNSC